MLEATAEEAKVDAENGLTLCSYLANLLEVNQNADRKKRITQQYVTTKQFWFTYFLFEHGKNIEQQRGHSVIWMCQATRCYQPVFGITTTQKTTTDNNQTRSAADNDDSEITQHHICHITLNGCAICFVNKLKYLGWYGVFAKCFNVSLHHMRVKFFSVL